MTADTVHSNDVNVFDAGLKYLARRNEVVDYWRHASARKGDFSVIKFPPVTSQGEQMSTNDRPSFRRVDDGDSPVADQESASRVVVPFRRREPVGDIGEAEEVTTTRQPDPAGGEVLLW
jgi:hypothetical protein